MKITDFCLLLLPFTLLIAHPASANNTEYCGIYNKDGTREILDLTKKMASHSRSDTTLKNYYDKCLEIARLSTTSNTVPVDRCKSYTNEGMYILINWKGKQYKSDNKIGYIIHLAGETRTVQDCTPVGFAGQCSFSTRQEKYSEDSCYVRFF